MSDLGRPCCVVGLGGLEKALDNLANEIDAEISSRPFELNSDMPAGGENGLKHIVRNTECPPIEQKQR